MALLDLHGEALALDGHIVTAVPLAQSVAFSTGAGSLWLSGRLHEQVHAGAILSACLAPDGDAILTGGDDGRLRRTTADGQSTDLLVQSRWVEHVVASRASGVIAAASGKVVHIVDGGQTTGQFVHGTTVTGLALDSKGRRLAASHYNGASLWWTKGREQAPVSLYWKGGHIGVTFSPDGRFVVTAMLESALHGWRLSDKADMRMSGYPTKTRSMAWSVKGRWLATSGAPMVVCWPFQAKDGPMGAAPLELGGPMALTTTVAAHPSKEVIAAGYEDGSVMLYRLTDGADVPVATPTRSPVSALAFSADGRVLGLGREDGSAGIVPLLG